MARRTILVLVALGAVLVGVGAATGGDADPVPIPGTRTFGNEKVHVFHPGPQSVYPLFQGENTEPSTITNFSGFAATAYLFGDARSGDNKDLRLEADVRVLRGYYLGEDGNQRYGSFATIGIAIYDGNGMRHMLSPGITASGLYWTIAIPADWLTISDDGTTARLRIRDLALNDSGSFLGKTAVPMLTDLDVRWRTDSDPVDRGSPSANPASPEAFSGTFRHAVARMTASGSQPGFEFSTWGVATSVFAETGADHNGVYR